MFIMIIEQEKMKAITFGAQDIVKENGYFVFKRFLDEQAQTYVLALKPDFCENAKSTAGIRLSFLTDATSISFDYCAKSTTSRDYANIDVYEDDFMTGHYEVNREKEDCFKHEFKSGKKHVEIYLPWSVSIKIKNVCLDGASFIEGKKRKLKGIAFGDSITQGYDSEHPSFSYVSQYAKQIDADVIDLGIGGDTHFADIVKTCKIENPDFVTVAYGTNDWAKLPFDEFCDNCQAFHDAIIEKFPTSQIFVITPIWRGVQNNCKNDRGIFLDNVREKIKEIAKENKNAIIIDGEDLVYKDKTLFKDLYLHPNDLGFLIYGKRLSEKMKAHLK